MSASRSWVMMCRDFLDNGDQSRELIYRHLAWLTALRYQLRSPRNWENLNKAYNREYKRHYSIPESGNAIGAGIKKIYFAGRDNIYFIFQQQGDSIIEFAKQCTEKNP